MKLSELISEGKKLEGVVDVNDIFSDYETDVFFTLFIDEPRSLENLPEQTIAVADLIPTQENIDGYKTSNTDPLVVAKRGGKYYVVDGHHRLGKARKKNVESLSCLVVEMPAEAADQAWFEKELKVKLRSRPGIVTLA